VPKPCMSPSQYITARMRGHRQRRDMGQVFRGSTSTTGAVRREMQHTQASIRALPRRHDVNPNTIPNRKAQDSSADAEVTDGKGAGIP
jgi:hypothetical protein